VIRAHHLLLALLSLATVALTACEPANADGDCLDDATEESMGLDIEGTDSDGDGLDDCTEIDLGTDPLSADGDGDGVSDADELDCVSDPNDADEVCYACGWEHNDPGDLSSAGAGLGDVVDNLVLHDQCGEPVSLWDLAGSYRLLYMTTQWCGSCRAEARTLAERTEEFLAGTDVPFSYVVVLFESSTGGLPPAAAAESYWDAIDSPDYPVTASVDASILDATPYAYPDQGLAGKCVLSPDLELLDCWSGHGEDTRGYDAIREHAGL
jgi:hypothetical protein